MNPLYACKVCGIKAEDEFADMVSFKYRAREFLIKHSHDEENRKLLERKGGK